MPSEATTASYIELLSAVMSNITIFFQKVNLQAYFDKKAPISPKITQARERN